ncbi:MAG: cyclopropane-fatty-acyl-phospholipid synthase family protein [Actinomycetota bacterium]|nr:cyclopropane-fatty-acyl-phospholipid synthase family protein [Actinomycetota bacterium]
MQLAEVFDRVTGRGTGVEFRAYDGSRSGPRDAPVRVEIRSPRAVNYLVQARNDLGLARAYVSGELEVHGDLHEVLRRLWRVNDGNVPWRERARVLRSVGLRALRPVSPPPEEVRLRGRRHSKRRDAVAVSHHYDVSNRFYQWILGPSMVYTCAVYPRADATLEQAQFAKLDLVCRKLGLRPGMRLLDVGCGWGGMVLHAARHYGVEALGVTLSRQQVEWGQRAIAEAGLAAQAEVQLRDYRDVPEGAFDAISSIGLTEHVGKAELPAYFAFLHSRLRPRGRLLNHCITRPNNRYPLLLRNGFIDRYVFPDGELLGPGHIISTMHDEGFELRHEENLREHYARTLAAWEDNLEAHWNDAVEEVGEARARIWRLYLAGSRVSFEEDGLELHQVLATKTESGDAAMPLRPDWELSRRAPEVPLSPT